MKGILNMNEDLIICKYINQRIKHDDSCQIEGELKSIGDRLYELAASRITPHVKCIAVEDNTMNGVDTRKSSWRACFTDWKTEKDFYAELIFRPGEPPITKVINY